MCLIFYSLFTVGAVFGKVAAHVFKGIITFELYHNPLLYAKEKKGFALMCLIFYSLFTVGAVFGKVAARGGTRDSFHKKNGMV